MTKRHFHLSRYGVGMIAGLAVFVAMLAIGILGVISPTSQAHGAEPADNSVPAILARVRATNLTTDQRAILADGVIDVSEQAGLDANMAACITSATGFTVTKSQGGYMISGMADDAALKKAQSAAASCGDRIIGSLGFVLASQSAGLTGQTK